MKVWLIAILLAVAVTAAVAEANVAVTGVTRLPEADAKTNENEDYETSGKDDEENDEGSNESSSEEHDEENKKTQVAVKTCGATTTHKPVAATKPRPYTPTPSYVKPAYVKPTYQVVTPFYRPAVTTEAPKTSTVSGYIKTDAPVQAPKYIKPAVVEVSTPKYVPISFEKPVATPAVTIRKSGWVRAPGYKLGYARAESTNPAVVGPLKYTAPATVSETVTVVTTTKSDEKPNAPRQTYPKWFFKTKSTGN
ncbi:uncharacterized protein LOC130703666 [Daphnia carinata]|uniref:uncharacterized protein LOC130703666 n=1 Tax=Daphnia carinata TaxID=120202 RepID=UPI00257E6B5A|nr:uncharacterized protein LOC130703666 [Daphnia carinata]